MRRALLVLGLAACGGAMHPMPNTCDGVSYPCGPYGYAVGSRVQDAQVIGRPDGKLDGEPQSLSFAAYHQAPELKLLVVLIEAGWCVACANEQPSLAQLYRDQAPAGVAFLEVLEEDGPGQPATIQTADRWVKSFSLPFDVAYDAENALGGYYNPASFPVTMVIDTAQMSILYQHVGADAPLDQVLASHL